MLSLNERKTMPHPFKKMTRPESIKGKVSILTPENIKYELDSRTGMTEEEYKGRFSTVQPNFIQSGTTFPKSMNSHADREQFRKLKE